VLSVAAEGTLFRPGTAAQGLFGQDRMVEVIARSAVA
jgi:hypothetical protein